MSVMLKTRPMAKLLDVSVQTIRRLLRANKVPFIRINSRVILFVPDGQECA